MSLETNVIRTLVRDLGEYAIHVLDDKPFAFENRGRSHPVPEKVMIGTGLELQARIDKMINCRDRRANHIVKFLFRTPTRKSNGKMRVVVGVQFI